jgi:hypothetical protein
MAAYQFRRIRLTFLWLRLCVMWAWRAWLKYVAWALLPIAFFSAIPYLSHWTELSIRVAGVCLQGCGLLGIVAGVIRTRQQFGLPSVPAYVAQKIREFPRFPADIDGTAASISALNRSSATGTITWSTVPSRDVEARLDALEKDHQELKTTVANQHGETLDQLRKHSAELEKEKTDRSEEDRQLRVTLHQTATGGLDLAVYGVIALAVANLYCTFPQEIACHMSASNCTSSSHSSNSRNLRL